MHWRSPRDGGSALHAPAAATPVQPVLARQIALVARGTHAIGYAIDREGALETTCSTTLELLDAAAAFMYVTETDEQRGRLLHSAGEPVTLLPAQLTIAPAWQASIVCGPIEQIGLECAASLQAGGYATFVAAPIHHGAILRGLMVAILRTDGTPSPVLLDLLRMLLAQLGSYLDSRELFTVLEDYALEMAQLANLNRISTASLNIDRLATDVSALLGEMTLAHVTVAVREGEHLRLYTAAGRASPDLELSAVPELQRTVDSGEYAQVLFTRTTLDLSPPLRDWMSRHRSASLTALPLIANQQSVGFLFFSAASESLDARAPILEMAANQIALQILNAHGHQQVQEALRQRLDELRLLEDIVRQITTVLNVSEIAAQVLRAAVTATNADSATLTLRNEDDRFITMRLEREKGGVAFRQLPGTRALEELPDWVQRALDQRGPILGSDQRKSASDSEAGRHSFAAAPLQRDNDILGALAVESRVLHHFTPEHLSFLTSLTGHAGISLENARLLEEHQYQIVALRNLQALAIELNGVETTPDAARAAIDAAMQMLGADEGAMYAYNPAGGTVTLLAARSSDDEPVRHRAAMSRGALEAISMGEVQTRIYANHQRTVISLPITRVLTPGRYALSLFFSRARPMRQRDTHNLLILSSYVAGQLDNTALNEQVRAASSRMRTILDTTASAILLLDRSGVVVECNRSAEHLLGIGAETALGKHISAMFMSMASSGGMNLSQTAITEFAQSLREYPDRSSERQVERSLNGTSLFLTENLTPVRNEADEIIGHLLVYRDVTDQVYNAQYREQVTHMVIHDLRGPLWSIMSGIDLAQDDLRAIPEAEPVLRLLEISANSAQNLMRLVESLLDINRLEQGQFPLNRAPVSPADLVESACAALDSAFKAAPINLRVDCDTALPLIDVDQDMMRRVLINLMDNALRHTPMQGEILVRAVARRSDILFLVADSGPGIPLDMREDVFKRYRQVAQNRPQRGGRGLGLGLAFCKLAVEAHGGRIAVEPTGPLPGATFSVSLPIWHGE